MKNRSGLEEPEVRVLLARMLGNEPLQNVGGGPFQLLRQGDTAISVRPKVTLHRQTDGQTKRKWDVLLLDKV